MLFFRLMDCYHETRNVIFFIEYVSVKQNILYITECLKKIYSLVANVPRFFLYFYQNHFINQTQTCQRTVKTGNCSDRANFLGTLIY